MMSGECDRCRHRRRAYVRLIVRPAGRWYRRDKRQMPHPFGVSFQPGTAAQGPQRGQGPGPGALPAQEAISLLNLRLPTRAAPTALAPQALLQSPGGAGQPGAVGASAEALMRLKRLLGLLPQAAPGPGRPNEEVMGSDRGGAPSPVLQALQALSAPAPPRSLSPAPPRFVPGEEGRAPAPSLGFDGLGRKPGAVGGREFLG